MAAGRTASRPDEEQYPQCHDNEHPMWFGYIRPLLSPIGPAQRRKTLTRRVQAGG
jgi:hypothetical protein